MDKYVPGESVPDFDSVITNAIKRLGVPLDRHGRMVIGFRNDQGKIYRKIKIEGMGNYVRLSQGIAGFGFTDELAESYLPREGCDNIYNRDE